MHVVPSPYKGRNENAMKLLRYFYMVQIKRNPSTIGTI